jgi:DNA primase
MATRRLLSRAEIDATRDRHPIVDVLALLGVEPPARWNGSSDFMVSCPYPAHRDSSPSCVIHPATDRYHCFGCGVHGDVLQLVRDVQGIGSLGGAIEFLDGGRAFPTPQPRPRNSLPPAQPRTSLGRVLDINAAAWDVLTEATAAAQARSYLARRGIDVAAVEHNIGCPLAGYTPAARAGLVDRLCEAGFTPNEVTDAGWAVDHDGLLADRFHRRIVLPIHDGEGRLLGVAARDVTGTARQKYLNTPRTVAFRKGSCLYVPIRPDEPGDATLIVCEGTLDALAIAAHTTTRHDAPPLLPVAPSGTALTDEQVQASLALGARRIVLCADGDPAGQAAAETWRSAFRAVGVDPRIVTLPDDHDPASWLHKHRASGLDILLGHGRAIAWIAL